MRGREDDAPARTYRERSRRDDLAREAECLVERGARLDQPADESEVERATGVDRLTGEDGVHRRRPTDGAREPEESAGRGDEVAPNLRQSERRSGGRHDDVRGEDDLQTARGRETVDGDHDRLRALAIHEPAEPASLGVERRRGTRLPDDLEVRARAEDGVRLIRGVGAQDPDPDVGIVLQPVHGGFEAERHLTIDRVARLGAVEGDDADPVGGRVQDGGHCKAPESRREPKYRVTGRYMPDPGALEGRSR